MVVIRLTYFYWVFIFAVLNCVYCDIPLTEIFRCDFEDDVCGFTSSPANLFRRNKGGTPSNLTGPSAAPVGDYYVYYEASEGENEAIFESRLIDGSQGWRDFRISFWMHAFGTQLGNLELRIVSVTQEVLETFNITAPSSEKWKKVTKFFNPKKGNGNGLFKVRFVATRKDFSGDYALDSLWIGSYMNLVQANCGSKPRCATNSACQSSGSSYKVGCTCKAGFVGNGFLRFNAATGCNAHGNCSTNPCDMNAICSIGICSCKPGFLGNGVKRSLKEGTGCLDLNECVTSDVCRTNELCINAQGGYKCQCKPGFYKPATEGATCTESKVPHIPITNPNPSTIKSSEITSDWPTKIAPNTNQPSVEVPKSSSPKVSVSRKVSPPKVSVSRTTTGQTKTRTTPYELSGKERSSKTDMTLVYIIVASVGGILVLIALVAVRIYWKNSQKEDKYRTREELNMYATGKRNLPPGIVPPPAPRTQTSRATTPFEYTNRLTDSSYGSVGPYEDLTEETDFPNYIQPNESISEGYEVSEEPNQEIYCDKEGSVGPYEDLTEETDLPNYIQPNESISEGYEVSEESNQEIYCDKEALMRELQMPK